MIQSSFLLSLGSKKGPDMMSFRLLLQKICFPVFKKLWIREWSKVKWISFTNPFSLWEDAEKADFPEFTTPVTWLGSYFNPVHIQILFTIFPPHGVGRGWKRAKVITFLRGQITLEIWFKTWVASCCFSFFLPSHFLVTCLRQINPTHAAIRHASLDLGKSDVDKWSRRFIHEK